MTKAKTKSAPAAPVTINETRMIPLNLIEADDANVRTIKNGVSIEMLAEDIALRGLLQSLNVRSVITEDGTDTGRFSVIAGGRRLKALQLLLKKSRIDAAQPIPCIVNTGDNPVDDSLAENVFREQLHPIDQFNAFKTLADQGMADTVIAKRYHVTEKFVRQRMKLAAASPKLLKAFKDEELSLEKLEAFCVTDDHKRQESILKLIKDGHHYNASNIRQALTEDSVEADDPRARFVGLDAYQAAGGSITQDLFKDDSGPWLEDTALLEKLATEKIEAVRTDILALGYKWAEVTLDPDTVWDLKRNLSSIPNLPSALSKDEKAELAALSTECDELTDKREWHEEDDPFTDADAARLAEINAALTALKNRPPRMSAKQIARTGVLISLDEEGRIDIEYGFLKPEDVQQAKKKASAQNAVGSAALEDGDDISGDASDDDDDDGDYVRADSNPGAVVGGKPLSDSLVRDLTSYRTVALQNALGEDFNTAFLAALHALCAQIFCHASYKSCAKISPSQQYFRAVAGLEDWPAYKEIQQRHEHWAERLPGDATALWNTLANLDDTERAQLFAHCVSLTIDAVHGNQGRASSALHSDQLAEALSLDMRTAGWESTAENYFARINKDQIIEAVKEAAPTKAPLIDHLKKQTMAQEAERIIKDTDWLPALLRAPHDDLPAQEQPEAAAEDAQQAAPLPAFLAGGLNGAMTAPAE